MTERRCDFCGTKADRFAKVVVPEGWSASMDTPPKPKRKKDEDYVMTFSFALMAAQDGTEFDACLSCIRRMLALREQFEAARAQLIGCD